MSAAALAPTAPEVVRVEALTPAGVAAAVGASWERGGREFRLRANPLWARDAMLAIRLELERVAAARWVAGPDVRLALAFESPQPAAVTELAAAALAWVDVEVLSGSPAPPDVGATLNPPDA
jgi:hypothetical protein